MKMQVYITKATRFDGIVDGTHYRNSKIWYQDDEVKNEENLKGCETVLVKGDYELFDKLEKVPGMYEVDYKMEVKNNKVSLYFLTAKPLPSAKVVNG